MAMTNNCERKFDDLFSKKGVHTYDFESGKLKGKDKKLKELFDKIGVPGKKCLDIGPGTGRWLQYLSMSEAAYLAAADISGEALKRCEDICNRTEKLDIESDSLPWDENYFDLVVSLEVLEHLRDYENYFKEIIRVSRKGAYVVISLPNIVSLISRIRMLAGLLPVAIASDDTHVGFYRKKDLSRILAKYGQKVVFVPTSFSLNPLKVKSRFRVPSNRWMSSFDDSILFYFIVTK